MDRAGPKQLKALREVGARGARALAGPASTLTCADGCLGCCKRGGPCRAAALAAAAAPPPPPLPPSRPACRLPAAPPLFAPQAFEMFDKDGALHAAHRPLLARSSLPSVWRRRSLQRPSQCTARLAFVSSSFPLLRAAGSGSIDIHELRQVLRAMGHYPTPVELADLMGRMDADQVPPGGCLLGGLLPAWGGCWLGAAGLACTEPPLRARSCLRRGRGWRGRAAAPPHPPRPPAWRRIERLGVLLLLLPPAERRGGL